MIRLFLLSLADDDDLLSKLPAFFAWVRLFLLGCLDRRISVFSLDRSLHRTRFCFFLLSFSFLTSHMIVPSSLPRCFSQPVDALLDFVVSVRGTHLPIYPLNEKTPVDDPFLTASARRRRYLSYVRPTNSIN